MIYKTVRVYSRKVVNYCNLGIINFIVIYELNSTCHLDDQWLSKPVVVRDSIGKIVFFFFKAIIAARNGLRTFIIAIRIPTK